MNVVEWLTGDAIVVSYCLCGMYLLCNDLDLLSEKEKMQNEHKLRISINNNNNNVLRINKLPMTPETDSDHAMDFRTFTSVVFFLNKLCA
jgi:hypothetical protein